MEITVDRVGMVISARPGIKGTTNNAECLLDAARRTALSYRLNNDSKAHAQQIGFVVINFKLGQ